MMHRVVMLLGHQIKAKHGVLQPTQHTRQEATCSFPLLVFVSTTMERYSSLGPAAFFGRHRRTMPISVAACTSIPATGAGAAATVPTATPCGQSRKSNFLKIPKYDSYFNSVFLSPDTRLGKGGIGLSMARKT